MKLSEKKLRVTAYDKGMTQSDIAVACELSRGTINGIFNGRTCSQETAEKIAEVLEVPIEKIAVK